MDNYFNNVEWQAVRLGKFTASEIHKLLKGGRKKDELFGETAKTYIREKIAEIITGEKKDDISGLKALEWGAAMENEAVETYQKLTGVKVEYFGVAAPKFFPFNAFSGGSPDGLSDEYVHEVKCPYVSANHVDFLMAARNGDYNAWLASEWPEYYAQVQFNMMCCKRDRGQLISYDPRTIEESHRLAVITIEKDLLMWDDITHRLTEAAKLITQALSTLSPSSIEI